MLEPNEDPYPFLKETKELLLMHLQAGHEYIELVKKIHYMTTIDQHMKAALQGFIMQQALFPSEKVDSLVVMTQLEENK